MQTTLADLLRQPEGRQLDFKRAEVEAGKALKTVCAFANTAGGHLVIGVADDRRVLGVADIAGLEERYASLITDRITPYLPVDLARVSYERLEVLVVKVPRFPGAFRLAGPRGGVYVRQGSTNRLASREVVAELEREAKARSWDERPCEGATLASIDQSAVASAYENVGKSVDEAKLKTLKLLVDQGGRLVPSNGAVVLFGKPAERNRLLPHAMIRAGRFAGHTKAEILDDYSCEMEGMLAALGGSRERPDDLGSVRAFIRRNTRNRALIGNVFREDVREYSDAILRELLPNAVAHADYSQPGMSIKLSIYSNRLELENPGGWPVGFALADIKAGVSKIRNPVIARVLHDLRYIEGWGSGYERILGACERFGYPEPEWREQGPVLRVRLQPHPATIDVGVAVEPPPMTEVKPSGMLTADLNERQAWFLKQITAGARVSASRLAEHFRISPRTAERDIRQLRDAELIAYIGPAKTGRYIPVTRPR